MSLNVSLAKFVNMTDLLKGKLKKKGSKYHQQEMTEKTSNFVVALSKM